LKWGHCSISRSIPTDFVTSTPIFGLL
jgi:hypothetical protein